MNAEQFFRNKAGFDQDTEIGVDWIPFSNLSDACNMMEEYAVKKYNDWVPSHISCPPSLPHLAGTDKAQSEKVLVHGDGVTTFASYHHVKKCWLPLGTIVTHWKYCPENPENLHDFL